MDLRLTSDQEQLVGAFAALFRNRVTAELVMAAEPLGYDERLWAWLVDLGALEMALPNDETGYGATLLDLALIAEQHGRHLAPTGMIEAQVALRLLARIDATSPVADLAEMREGGRLVTLALRPARGGACPLVPSGAVADEAVVLDGDRLVLARIGGKARHVANLGCLPLADVTVDGTELVIAEGPTAVQEYADAIDEWRSLTAAALTGLATRALEIGVEYVKERKAFGRPVGQFQAVAHRLADRVTEVHGAELLSREAAWARHDDPERFSVLASMALGFSAETAVSTSHDALHFHGGYGFMLEYPSQLYYRRARTWAAVLESPAQSFRRVGGRHLADTAATGGN